MFEYLAEIESITFDPVGNAEDCEIFYKLVLAVNDAAARRALNRRFAFETTNAYGRKTRCLIRKIYKKVGEDNV